MLVLGCWTVFAFKNSGDFWKSPFYWLPVCLEHLRHSPQSHHLHEQETKNPSVPSKTTPLLPKDFWREISSENFKSAPPQTKQKRRRRQISQNLLEI
jgi:hypothetical protein